MKQTLSLSVTMNIDLPEDDCEITEAEKCAIIDRIHGYLTNIGTTSDDYEGALAGEISPLGTQFELLVKEEGYPVAVQAILDSFDTDADPYKECTQIVEQLEQIGWTADFGLDGILCGIHATNLHGGK